MSLFDTVKDDDVLNELKDSHRTSTLQVRRVR